MQSKEARVEVNRDFNPLDMTQKEMNWQYHDATGQYILAFTEQVLAVQYQFNLSPAAAERIVLAERPKRTKLAFNPKMYFFQLATELKIVPRLASVEYIEETNLDDHAINLSRLWGAIYEVEPDKLLPLWKKRLADFDLIKPPNNNWPLFREGLLAYYEGLHAVISVKPTVT